MVAHVVKFTHEDGKELRRHERVLWCGADAAKIGFDFTFQDAQHALLSIENGARVRPCKKCISAMVRLINGEPKS